MTKAPVNTRASEKDSSLDVEESGFNNFQKHTLASLLKIVFRHKWPLCVGTAMVILGTFAVLMEPRIFGYAIDEAIIPKRMDLLEKTALVFLLATIVRIFAAIKQGYFFELLGQRVTQDLRVMLFTRLQSMPVSVYDRNPGGRLLTRVTNDVAALNEMFSAGFLSMLCNILMVAGILAWLIFLDLRLGLIASSVFPLLVVISAYFSKRLKIAYRDSRSRLSSLNSFLAENLHGMRIIHLFNRQKLHLERFNRLNQWYAEAQGGSVRVFALFQPTITVAAGISIGLTIWYGGLATLDGNLKLGVLVTYFSLAMSLFQPVREIADKWNIFLSGMASAERIFSILEWEPEFECTSFARPVMPLAGVQGHIVFENVWFSYSPNASAVTDLTDSSDVPPDLRVSWVLKDFSLDISPGERLGVVGHTGAGKTTLISLLLRFYEPQRGRILLDGKDIRSYDKRSLRASIGIVQQDVFLFSGSFQDNITFWQAGATEAVTRFFSQIGFRPKFDKVLQERGSNFSMGERQVIAFARAMAADPKIWILDEATANMDSETEALIQRALNRATVSRTSILIAHRLATVRNADRIIVLHKGNLIESGNHETLMSENGLYARLYRYQIADPTSVA
ncbi:MAG: ABC transporter ATP-binding protein [Bdellovibrionia bacterium]